MVVGGETKRRRTRWSRPVLVVLVASLAVASATASAAWGPATPVFHGYSSSSAVAVAGDGVATIAWSDFDGGRVVARRYSATGQPVGGELELADEEAREVALAVAPDGTVTAVWTRGVGLPNLVLEARRIDPDGNVDPAIHSLDVGLQNFDVDVAPDGKATIVWEDYDTDRIAMRQLDAGGTLGATEYLSAPGGNAGEPFVAVAPEGDEAGTVTAAFIRFNGSRYIAHARRISASGALSPTTHDLSSAAGSAYYPEVAVAADGTATVVFEQTSQAPAASWIRAQRVLPNDTLGGGVDLSPTDGFVQRETAVAIDAADRVLVGWAQRQEPGFRYVPRARAIDAEDTPGPVLPLGDAVLEYTGGGWIGVAPTPEGAVFVWETAFEDDPQRVWGRDLIDGELQPLVELGVDVSWDPSVAAAPDGTATAIWNHWNEETGEERLMRSWTGVSGPARLAAAATPSPRRVKAGKRVTVAVRARNLGEGAASRVRACPKLSRQVARVFKSLGGSRGCKPTGTIEAGGAKTVKLRFKARPGRIKAGKRYSLVVELKGRDAVTDATLPSRRAAAFVRGRR